MATKASKRTVTAYVYALEYNDTRHQLTATSSNDLAQQVQQMTGNKQVAKLARAAWGDTDADLSVHQARLVCVGAIVRETYRSLPPLKGQDRHTQEEALQSAPELQEAPGGEAQQAPANQEAAAPTAPAPIADTLPQAWSQPAAPAPTRTFLGVRMQPAPSQDKSEVSS